MKRREAAADVGAARYDAGR